MKTITASAYDDTFEILVSDADYDLVSHLRWGIQAIPCGLRYAVAREYPNVILMHRLIMDAKDGQLVDHIDGNGLNNQRENLRLCTRRQNLQNIRKRNFSRKTSRFKGVRYRANYGTFHAEIECSPHRLHLGAYESEHDAAVAYDAAAHLLFGPFARPNFGEPFRDAPARLPSDRIKLIAQMMPALVDLVC